MAYRIAAIPLTLNDLQNHSLSASFFKSDFSHSCTAVDKIAIDREASY